jgi:predicted secreted protein
MNRTLLAMAAAVAIAATSAAGALCSKCKDMMFTMAVGRCSNCPNSSASGSHRLCAACSAKLGRCEHCGEPPAQAAPDPVQRVRPPATRPATRPSTRPATLPASRPAIAPASSPASAAAGAEMVDVLSFSGELVVTVGQRVQASLKGNATTGFAWSVASIDGESVKQAGAVKYVPQPSGPQRVGAGGEFVAVFEAVKPGTSTITFTYARPWKEGEVADTRTLKVTVAAR